MSFSVDELARIAIDLQSDIGHTDRFSRLITTLRQILGCDASALLRYEAHQFVPLAIDGLAQDVLGRRFALEGHPRLEAIARAGDVVRFPADSDLPDPYDGLIPGHESLKVHACVGLPLFAGQTLIGALTLDGMDADRFDSFSDEELRLIAALVAGALNNALLIARLEAQNVLPAQAVNYPLPERQEIIGLSGAHAAAEKRDRYRRRLGFKRADQRRNRHRQRAGGEGGASGGRREPPTLWCTSTARRCRKAWRRASCSAM